jgi:carbamate kinase
VNAISPDGPIVIALGGNAISPEGETDTIENQFRRTSNIARSLVRMIEAGWREMVVTHGNGPQVGNVVKRVEHSKAIAPWLPLDICVADTQGGMGYMIEQCVRNALSEAGIGIEVATLVTQVVVDAADPAFQRPTKEIGHERRMVPSPVPTRVLESEVVKMLCRHGVLVIAGGGGGVPVVETDGRFSGVEAVVDKDLTGSLIARSIEAHAFVILTDVDGVYTNYGEPTQRRIESVTPRELRELANRGEFPSGTMGPKIDAACSFVEGGGNVSVIGALDEMESAIEGKSGTRITAES